MEIIKGVLFNNWSWGYENNNKTSLFIIEGTYIPKLTQKEKLNHNDNRNKRLKHIS